MSDQIPHNKSPLIKLLALCRGETILLQTLFNNLLKFVGRKDKFTELPVAKRSRLKPKFNHKCQVVQQVKGVAEVGSGSLINVQVVGRFAKFGLSVDAERTVW